MNVSANIMKTFIRILQLILFIILLPLLIIMNLGIKERKESKKKMKYNEIIQCDLVNEYNTYKNAFILTYKECENYLEIDLTGDFMFNCDYKKINTKHIKYVKNIKDVLNFCKKHNIYVRPEVYDKKYNNLYVGACNDRKINKNLEDLGWFEV